MILKFELVCTVKIRRQKYYNFLCICDGFWE
jgi:hypothetical protein